jgi:hypothetical protein
MSLPEKTPVGPIFEEDTKEKTQIFAAAITLRALNSQRLLYNPQKFGIALARCRRHHMKEIDTNER